MAIDIKGWSSLQTVPGGAVNSPTVNKRSTGLYVCGYFCR